MTLRHTKNLAAAIRALEHGHTNVQMSGRQDGDHLKMKSGINVLTQASMGARGEVGGAESPAGR